ncbi:hypothetical protein ANN_25343 [Periplaneta americana]|uniref:Uncharacterized protein n=1 Tax=Periplaneta americana TaxID=6978 RepID=A0ABQ8S143_PERAM|nr:hypothetical protein ANN_25343 [Periplaneta americana]
MAGLCEGGNEPPGSLKANLCSEPLAAGDRNATAECLLQPLGDVQTLQGRVFSACQHMRDQPGVGLGSVVNVTLAFCARGCEFDPGPGRWHLSVFKCDRLMSVDLLAYPCIVGPYHHGMARLQVADRGDGLQIWGGPPAWGLGEGLTTHHRNILDKAHDVIDEMSWVLWRDGAGSGVNAVLGFSRYVVQLVKVTVDQIQITQLLMGSQVASEIHTVVCCFRKLHAYD